MSGVIQTAEGGASVDKSLPSALIERRLAWLAFAGLSVVFILSMVWRPADEPTFILCPFRAMTGLLCPGCGMTRAFCALGHGEIRRAIHFNALSPALYLSMIIVWIGAAATVLNLTKLKATVMKLRPSPTLSVVMLSVVLLWWIARLVWGI